MLLVNFSKVSKDYAGNAVLDQIDLEIIAGERIGLVGENGSGKTTLLRLMAGVDVPTVGTIEEMEQTYFCFILGITCRGHRCLHAPEQLPVALAPLQMSFPGGR